MEGIFNRPEAVGLRVKVTRRNGDKVTGRIDRFIMNNLVSVTFDPEFVEEWEDDHESFHPRDLKLDYDPEGMKAVMNAWRGSTKQTAGPLGPMKHVKSFLTGRSRKRKTRKQKKKTRKTGKRI
jgi:hypothetical protein